MQKLAAALSKAAELDAQMTGKPVAEDFLKDMKLLGAGLFRIVVMGEIKKGKSSFINALLNHKELVPTSSNVATSTIFKIHYGRQVAYKVFFTKESGKGELPIGPDDLPKFGTEDGNPGNEKQVDFIEVCCPSPLLQTGAVIIDTPGLGGTFREHKKITYQYVPKADAVFFVTDSVESPIGALETEYLKDIRNITKHVYFVQTKTGSVDADAAEARKANNLDILARTLGMKREGTPYYMVDSELRQIAEEEKDTELLQLSGYPELLAFVNRRLLPAKRTILAEKAVTAVTPVLQHLANQIQEKEQFLNADTEDKRNQAKEAVENAQKSLMDWETKEKGKLLRSISKAMDDNRREVIAMLSQCRPNGEIQTEMENLLAQAADKDQLVATMRQINDMLPEYASKCMQETSNELRKKTERVLTEQVLSICPVDTTLSTEVRAGGTEVNRSRMGRMLAEIENESGGTFTTLRTGLYGTMAGVGIASVVGGVIGSVVPVVGTLIGSYAGMAIAGWWGANQALKLQEQQELRSLRNQATGAITTAVSDMYNKMMSNFDQLNADIKAAVQNAVEESLRQRSDDLRTAVAELQERAKMNTETLQKRRQGLDALKRDLATIRRVIEEYLPA